MVVRVKENYDAKNDQELTLDVAQIVTVLGIPFTGWYKGELQIGRERMVGTFPMSVVERI
jgi:hypothetical protein